MDITIVEFFRHFHFVNEAWCFTTPLCMMALDIILGTINAIATKTFKSSRMRVGLSKKSGEIAILVLGELFSFAMGLPKELMTGVSAYIIFMEFMSIMENCEKSGVPVPKFIKAIVNNVDESLSEDDYKALTTRLNQAIKTVEELEEESKKKG
ncbi:phage holin family protein [Absicoccus porci]|uniref:phage holin family protein n=1 Tax=Absicoccus porci TaxID=2486576 RepID=UPI0029428062|nr:phage holin family protein [Absicoccus porci]